MSSNPHDKQKGRGHSQQVFNQGLWSSMFLHVGGDQFTCCSLSIRELVLWTLAVCDRFFLCRITKQYLILKVCYLYKKMHWFGFFFFTVTLFFFLSFSTHCRTLNWGNSCKNSWEWITSRYIQCCDWDYCTLLKFVLVVGSVTDFFLKKSIDCLGTCCFIYFFIFITF